MGKLNDTKVTGNLDVTENLKVDGNLEVAGNVVNITVVGESIQFALSTSISSGTWLRFAFSYICID